jgi:hypothetical protein
MYYSVLILPELFLISAYVYEPIDHGRIIE